MNSYQGALSYSRSTPNVQVEEVFKYHQNKTRDFIIHSMIQTHIPMFFQSIRPTVESLINSSRQRDIVKVSLGIRVILRNTEGEEISIYYNSTFSPLLAGNKFKEFYDNTRESIFEWLDGFQDRGSGLLISSIRY